MYDILLVHPGIGTLMEGFLNYTFKPTNKDQSHVEKQGEKEMNIIFR
jgi:hypothetical protein